jgi:MFS family permease
MAYPTLQTNFLQSINPLIRLLIISDVLLVSGSGLLGPIFALFITDFIVGGSPAIAGVAVTIYLFTKSILQLPVSLLIDKIKGEVDDYVLMTAGSFGLALMPLAYLYINTPIELYVIQFILGVLAAITFPGYMAIFTRHIDKNKEGLEWGMYFTMVDLASATTATVGGILATTIGFKWVIVGVLCLKTTGALLLFPVKYYIKTP